MKCPKCGKKTIFDHDKCPRCGHIFFAQTTESFERSKQSLESEATIQSTEVFTMYVDEPEPLNELKQCKELIRSVTYNDSIEKQVKCYNSCIERYPKIDIGFLRLAQTMSKDEAFKLLIKALSQSYCKSQVLHRIAHIHLERKQWNEAIITLTSSIWAAKSNLSSIGDSYLYLAPLYAAAKMEEARLIEKTGSKLSGCSLDNNYWIDFIGGIWNSGGLADRTKALLHQAYQIIKKVEEQKG